MHRPRYDDWSLPKGKLQRSEHPAAAAARECREETGFSPVLGRRLGQSSYQVLQDGVLHDKSVLWWGARCAEGEFTPNSEVDELRWLAPEDAADMLTAGRDVEVLHALTAVAARTATVLLVRHGRAGNRRDWSGDDEDRPLDVRGRQQAERLAGLLPLFGVRRLVSAPPLRCRATLGPLAHRLDIEVEAEPLFGETEAAGLEAPRAVERLLSYADPDQPVAVCSQGGVIPRLLAGLDQRKTAGAPTQHAADTATRKGDGWALTLTPGERAVRDPLESGFSRS